MWIIDNSNVLIADIVFASAFIIIGLLYKEQRIPFVVGGSIYGFFTYTWHVGFGISL